MHSDGSSAVTYFLRGLRPIGSRVRPDSIVRRRPRCWPHKRRTAPSNEDEFGRDIMTSRLQRRQRAHLSVVRHPTNVLFNDCFRHGGSSRRSGRGGAARGSRSVADIPHPLQLAASSSSRISCVTDSVMPVINLQQTSGSFWPSRHIVVGNDIVFVVKCARVGFPRLATTCLLSSECIRRIF